MVLIVSDIIYWQHQDGNLYNIYKVWLILAFIMSGRLVAICVSIRTMMK